MEMQTTLAEKRGHRKWRRVGLWSGFAGFYLAAFAMALAGAFVPDVAQRIETMSVFLGLIGAGAHAVFGWYMKISSDEYRDAASIEAEREMEVRKAYRSSGGE